MGRQLIRIALQVVIATALTVLFGWVLYLFIGNPPLGALVEKSIPLVLVFIDIAIVTWLILLIVGAARGRGIGWGFGGAVLAALIGTIVNLVWIVILSALGGGVDGAAVALGLQAGVFFLIASTIATVVVSALFKDPDASTPA